eukprot:NODE_15_length_50561_cov_0.608081.p1 type:complete len:2351 gc:universal NODE_15_length_50561_cov_0.608081:35919-42971(+)
MLLIISAIVLILLSGYGVAAPMIIRDILGNGDIFVYPDHVSLDLRPQETNVYFKGEFFITRNNIDAYIHETFYRIYYRNQVALGLTLSDMQTYTDKRTNLDFHTQLLVFNASLIDQLLREAIKGENADVIMQGYMGVSVFKVPMYSKVFVERYLLPKETNLRQQLQDFMDGTLPPGSLDPTLKQYPKPVIPPLNTPKINGLTLYRKSNQIGINIKFEWKNDFIELHVAEIRIPLLLYNVNFGGLYLENLRLTNGLVKGNVNIGLYLLTGDEIKKAFQHAFKMLIKELTIQVGVVGPLRFVAEESVVWIANATKSLNASLTIDIPRVTERFGISLPSAPKAMLDLKHMSLEIKIRTVKKSIDLGLELHLPSKFPKLPKVESLIGVALKLGYIKDLIQIEVGKLHIVNQFVQLGTRINFFDQPRELRALVDRFMGKKSDQTIHAHDMEFFPSCPTCKQFDNIDFSIDPPEINFSQYVKFGKSILKNTNLGLKIYSLSVIQKERSFFIDVDFQLDLLLPIDAFIGYLAVTLQINHDDFLTLSIENLRWSKTNRHKLSLEITFHKSSQLSLLIPHLLDYLNNKNSIPDIITISSIKIGESKQMFSSLFSEIDIDIKISELLESISLPQLDLNLDNVLEPTFLTLIARDTIKLGLKSIFNNPLDFDLHVHLDPIKASIDNSIFFNIAELNLSHNLELEAEISFKNAKAIIQPILEDFLNHKFNRMISLSLGSITFLENAKVDINIPELSLSSGLINLSHMNLNNPISNFKPDNIDINHHGNSIKAALGVDLTINVPIVVDISSIQVGVRLQKNKFLKLSTGAIKIHQGLNEINLPLELQFNECTVCETEVNQLTQNLLSGNLIETIIGIQDLHIGEIEDLESISVDLFVSQNIHLPKLPAIQLPNISPKNLAISVHDKTINAKGSLSLDLNWIKAHFQRISLYVTLNNQDLVRILIHHLDVNRGVNFEISLEFFDASKEVLQLYNYLTVGYNEINIGVHTISLDQIYILRSINAAQPVGRFVEPAIIHLDEVLNKPLPALPLESVDIVSLDQWIVLDILAKIPIDVKIDASLALQVALNDHSLLNLKLSLSGHNMIRIGAKIMLFDIAENMKTIGSIISNVLSSRDLSGSISIKQIVVGNINSFERISVDIPLSIIKVPSLTLPAIKMSGLSVKNVEKDVEVKLHLPIKLPKLPFKIDVLLVQLHIFDSAFVTLSLNPIFKNGVDLTILAHFEKYDNPEINTMINSFLETKNLDLQVGISKIALKTNKGLYKISNKIPIDIHQKMTLPQLSLPTLELKSLNIHTDENKLIAQIENPLPVHLDYFQISLGHNQNLVTISAVLSSKIDIFLEFNNAGADEMKILLEKFDFVQIYGMKIGTSRDFHQFNLDIHFPLHILPKFDFPIPSLPSIKISPENVQLETIQDHGLMAKLRIQAALPIALNLNSQNIKVKLGLGNPMILAEIDSINITGDEVFVSLKLFMDNQYRSQIAEEISKLLHKEQSHLFVSELKIDSIMLFSSSRFEVPIHLPIDESKLGSSLNDLTSQHAETLSNITINHVKAVVNPDNSLTTSLSINFPFDFDIKVAINYLQVGLRINEQSLLLAEIQPIKIQKAMELDVKLKLNSWAYSKIEKVGIEYLKIGYSDEDYISLFEDVKLDVNIDLKNIKLPSLPNIDLSIKADSANLNIDQNISGLAKLKIPNIFLSIPFIRVSLGALMPSIFIQLSVITSELIEVNFLIDGHADDNELLAMRQLVDKFLNGNVDVFLDELQFGHSRDSFVSLKIGQQIKTKAPKLPAIKLPSLVVDPNNVKASISEKITLKTSINLDVPVTFNVKNIELEVFINERLANIHIDAIKADGVAEISVIVEPHNVQESTQLQLNEILNNIIQKTPLNADVYIDRIILGNLNNLELIHLKLPNLDLPQITLPKIEPILNLDKANINLIGDNQLFLTAKAGVSVGFSIDAQLDKLGLSVGILDNPFLEARISGDVKDVADVEVNLSLQKNPNLNALVHHFLNDEKFTEYIMVGIKLQQNLLDKVKIKINIQDLLSKNLVASSEPAKQLIKSVQGAIVSDGIAASIELDLPISSNINSITAVIHKGGDSIFNIAVDAQLPSVNAHLKPIFPAMQFHMSQIYRRMKLGVNLVSDISIGGILLSNEYKLNILEDIFVDKLPDVSYVEGILPCRMHTLNPIKLIKDPGIGTDVFFKASTLPFPVDLDLGTLYFDVLDYNVYNDTLKYEVTMDDERAHINELVYPVNPAAIGNYSKVDYTRNCIHNDHIKYYNVNTGLLFFIRWVNNPLKAVDGLFKLGRKKLLRNFKITRNGEEMKWLGEMMLKTNVYVHVKLDHVPDFEKNPRPDR